MACRCTEDRISQLEFLVAHLLKGRVVGVSGVGEGVVRDAHGDGTVTLRIEAEGGIDFPTFSLGDLEIWD